MVARTRFATDLEWLMARELVGASETTGCPVLNDVNDSAAGRGRYLGREQAFARHDGEGQTRFVGRFRRKVEGVKAHRRVQDAIVEENPHQGSQRRRAVTGSPNGSGIGRRKCLERIPETFPELVDLGEGLEF
jgi:hypothetical protein